MAGRFDAIMDRKFRGKEPNPFSRRDAKPRRSQAQMVSGRWWLSSRIRCGKINLVRPEPKRLRHQTALDSSSTPGTPRSASANGSSVWRENSRNAHDRMGSCFTMYLELREQR